MPFDSSVLALQACTPNPVVNPGRDRNGASGGRAAGCRALAGHAQNGQPQGRRLRLAKTRGGMDGSDTSPDAVAGIPQPDVHVPPEPQPRHLPHGSLLLRELPYVVVLILTLVGVAYASFSRQSMVGYWEFLAPLIGLLCVILGWPHAPDKAARWRLIWTQALHWAAFLAAMNLLL